MGDVKLSTRFNNGIDALDLLSRTVSRERVLAYIRYSEPTASAAFMMSAGAGVLEHMDSAPGFISETANELYFGDIGFSVNAGGVIWTEHYHEPVPEVVFVVTTQQGPSVYNYGPFIGITEAQTTFDKLTENNLRFGMRIGLHSTVKLLSVINLAAMSRSVLIAEKSMVMLESTERFPVYAPIVVDGRVSDAVLQRLQFSAKADKRNPSRALKRYG